MIFWVLRWVVHFPLSGHALSKIVPCRGPDKVNSEYAAKLRDLARRVIMARYPIKFVLKIVMNNPVIQVRVGQETEPPRPINANLLQEITSGLRLRV